MTNYYDELKLDSTASPAALQEELIRLEMLWHEREMNRPEIAAKKLVLITEAKKVFASEATKAQYDRELNAVPEETAPEDPDAARKAQFARWVGDAVDYYQQGQYDLAKTAIERAMSYGSGEEDAAFHHIAAQIYYRNGEYSTAMSSVNKAIVSRADMAEYYLTKGLIYEGQYLEAVRNRFNNAQTYAVQERETLRQAAATAVRTGDRGVQGRALGYLAFSLYNHTPQDAAQAEQAAQEAVSVGDDWGNARKVLDDIARKRAAAEQAELERKRRQEQAELEAKARQAQQEKARQEQARREARKKRIHGFAILLMILAWAGMALTVYIYFKLFQSIPVNQVILLGIVCVGLLNYSAYILIGYVETWVQVVSAIFNLWMAVFGLGGYGYSSSGPAWKTGGIVLAVCYGVTFLARLIGTAVANSTTKTK